MCALARQCCRRKHTANRRTCVLSPAPAAVAPIRPQCKHCGDHWHPSHSPHVAPDCPLLQRCFTCGSKSHKQSTCPRRNGAVPLHSEQPPRAPPYPDHRRPSFAKPDRDRLPLCEHLACRQLALSVFFFACELGANRSPRACTPAKDPIICVRCHTSDPALVLHGKHIT